MLTTKIGGKDRILAPERIRRPTLSFSYCRPNNAGRSPKAAIAMAGYKTMPPHQLIDPRQKCWTDELQRRWHPGQLVSLCIACKIQGSDRNETNGHHEQGQSQEFSLWVGWNTKIKQRDPPTLNILQVKCIINVWITISTQQLNQKISAQPKPTTNEKNVFSTACLGHCQHLLCSK